MFQPTSYLTLYLHTPEEDRSLSCTPNNVDCSQEHTSLLSRGIIQGDAIEVTSFVHNRYWYFIAMHPVA